MKKLGVIEIPNGLDSELTTRRSTPERAACSSRTPRAIASR